MDIKKIEETSIVKKTIPVEKITVENVDIYLPMYFYMEDITDDGNTEYGLYCKIDKDFRAILFISEYEHVWIDERPYPKKTSYKIEIVENYYPNEIEIANQITRKQFFEGIQEGFWSKVNGINLTKG